MRTFVIHANDAGQRADKFLLKACPKLPKSLLYKTFRKRDVKCGGKRIPPETLLHDGDVLQVYLPDDCFGEPAVKTLHALPKPETVYEDDAVVLLKKPVNLPVHTDDRGSSDTLADRFLYDLAQRGIYNPAAEQSFSPALCNRLDRNTEGFVIGAKTAAALRAVNAKIRCGEVRKQYLCITAGIPQKREDTVIAYHKREAGEKAMLSEIPKDGYQQIKTGYRVLAAKDGLALLLVTLYTGKTHQIRVQTAALGCPVLGDAKYGDPAANRRYGETHQLLAACRLHFDFADDGVLSGIAGRTFSYLPDFCAKYGLMPTTEDFT